MNFHDLVYQLSQKLDTDLQVDSNGACQFIVDNNIALQIEPHISEELVIISSHIYELPPGKFREDVLIAALKANASFPPSLPILAYSDKTNTLILFSYLATKTLHIDPFTEYLSHFLAIALDWKKALDSGQISPIKTYLTKDQSIDLAN